MSSDPTIREQGYQYFLREAPELLQAIEQELLSLGEDRSLVKVHSLMRTTHTLKGAAANVGLETIKTIAHHLEDVFKALYTPDLVIDAELETLLLEGYECLRLPLMAEITGSYINDAEVMDRAVSIFAQLQEKLGDYFAREAPIPTSVELGFDITQSIFEVGVKQRLESLAAILVNCESWEIALALQEQAEIFIGLAESLSLPGFGAIAQKALTAVKLHPEQANTVLEIVLMDFWQAWTEVMAGDRTRGGEPSFALQQLAGTILPIPVAREVAQSEGAEEQRSTETEQEEMDSLVSDVAEFLDESETILELNLETVDFSAIALEPTLDDVFGDFAAETEAERFAIESLEEQTMNATSTDVAEAQERQEADNAESREAEEQRSEEPENTRSTGAEELKRQEVTPPVPQSPVTYQPSPTITHHPSPVTHSQPSVKTPRASVRVDLDLLERLSHLVGEQLIHQNRQVNIAEQLQSTIEQMKWRLRRHQQTMSQLRDWSDLLLSMQTRGDGETSRGAEGQRNREDFSIHNYSLPITHYQSPITHHFDSLELDRYSELHELLQSAFEELVQLEEATDSTELLAKQSSQILEKQRRLLHSVQDDMREARMLPLGEIFSRFPRLLQQLSNTHKKPVELNLYGTEVLVDRALAEKLYDPLLHLVRNAFDHGIEPPEARCMRGKPETGEIEIRAYHQGNQTIIEVCDDGQGINLERIRQRAVELHWMSAEKANNLSETALLELLFEPGFSTASAISELSGRGIGLNVVRSQMQALAGAVMIRTEPQRGTTFLLQFPLTLTMAKLMVCETGGAVYALLSDAIEQILIPKSDQIQEHNGQKVLHLNKGNSGIVPVYNMAQLLGSSSEGMGARGQGMQPLSSPPLSFSASSPLLLLRQRSQALGIDSELVGLEVDQIIGEQELVIRPLGKAIAPPNYVYGGSTLADGRLTLVIDGAALVNHLFDQLAGKLQVTDAANPWLIEAHHPSEISNLQLKESGISTPLLPAPISLVTTQPPSRMAPPKILVVDDSISLRQTLALTLQKAAYQVLQAQNGREAIQHMQQNRGIQVVICDIEMPSMNGFEFLNYCRQDAELSQVPVVMLTSRTSEKHRLIAQELGAVGYFTKPYRDDEILKAIADLLHQNATVMVPG